jgi:hypothetical protein
MSGWATVRAVDPVTVASLCIPEAAFPKDGLLRRTVEVRAGAITKAAMVIADTLFVRIIRPRSRNTEQEREECRCETVHVSVLPSYLGP